MTMTPEQAVEHVNRTWIYSPDGRFDRWQFRSPGDCENYSCLVLSAILGGNGKARRALLMGRAHIVYCHTLSGDGHAVLEFKGRFVDNRYQRWMTSLDDMKLAPKRRRYSRIELLIKLGVGRL